MAYIAMEVLEGRSLQRMLREPGRLPLASIVHIAAQVADALDHALQFGIVHRDVKPANIMVSAAGRAKLTVFGVAHVPSSSMTQTRAALGSPKYMSPEQVTGQPIDAPRTSSGSSASRRRTMASCTSARLQGFRSGKAWPTTACVASTARSGSTTWCSSSRSRSPVRSASRCRGSSCPKSASVSTR